MTEENRARRRRRMDRFLLDLKDYSSRHLPECTDDKDLIDETTAAIHSTDNMIDLFTVLANFHHGRTYLNLNNPVALCGFIFMACQERFGD